VTEEETGGTSVFSIKDPRGTREAEVDASGNVTRRAYVNAFGLEIAASGSASSIFWYQGEAWWKLIVNGRTYYVSPTRIYAVQDGRFVERDRAKSPAATPVMYIRDQIDLQMLLESIDVDTPAGPVEEGEDVSPETTESLCYALRHPVGGADPYGQWEIRVDFPTADRRGAGDLVLFDKDGKPLRYAVARGQGKWANKTHTISVKWWLTDGDTPTGEYTAKLDSSAQKKAQFGAPPYVLLVSASSGHAAEAYVPKGERDRIFIHAGRKEFQVMRKVKVILRWNETLTKEGKTVYEAVTDYQVRAIPGNTLGCIRLTQEDLNAVTTCIANLIKAGEEEEGKVIVTGPQEDKPKKQAK
jgi:hypothetical protein